MKFLVPLLAIWEILASSFDFNNTDKQGNLRVALLLFLGVIHISCQTHSNLNSFNEPCFLMIPTERTDGIDDFVNLLQWFSVHEPVEFLKVGFDGCVIEAAGFSERQICSETRSHH